MQVKVMYAGLGVGSPFENLPVRFSASAPFSTVAIDALVLKLLYVAAEDPFQKEGEAHRCLS